MLAISAARSFNLQFCYYPGSKNRNTHVLSQQYKQYKGIKGQLSSTDEDLAAFPGLGSADLSSLQHRGLVIGSLWHHWKERIPKFAGTVSSVVRSKREMQCSTEGLVL